MVAPEVYDCCKNECAATTQRPVFVLHMDESAIDYNTVIIMVYVTGGAAKVTVRQTNGNMTFPPYDTTTVVAAGSWTEIRAQIVMKRVTVLIEPNVAGQAIKYFMCRKLATCCTPQEE